MLVGLVSGMDNGHADDGDLSQSAYTLPHGATGSRSADHAEAVPLQLYSGCTARQGPSVPSPVTRTALR